MLLWHDIKQWVVATHMLPYYKSHYHTTHIIRSTKTQYSNVSVGAFTLDLRWPISHLRSCCSPDQGKCSICLNALDCSLENIGLSFLIVISGHWSLIVVIFEKKNKKKNSVASIYVLSKPLSKELKISLCILQNYFNVKKIQSVLSVSHLNEWWFRKYLKT